MDEDEIAELFSAFGPVTVKRMFGGAGLYSDGVMFALVADGLLYLKADAAFAADLAARGSEPFSYMAKTGPRTMSGYLQVPEAALDDADDLAALARRACEVAQAAALKKAANARGGKRRKPAAK